MTKTITAKVSKNLLKKAPLLFNQTDKTLIHELLQNCRRAGATEVSITVTPSGEGARVTVSDNGDGIADPAELLNLGNSGWDDETKGLEAPAGMGFFSLCHLPEGVEVRSGDWAVQIDARAFLGDTGCDVVAAPQRAGTSLSFFVPSLPGQIENTIKTCLEFYPVRASLNGTEMPRKDFLAKATYVHPFQGGRIGVYTGRISYFEDTINFYGLSLTAHEAGLQVATYGIKVDVENTDALDLVLPARNKVVENRKLEDLRTTCRIAVYKHIDNSGGSHRLPFKLYAEARNLGIEIPEAKAELQVAMPRNLHEESSNWTGNTAPNYAKLPWDTQKAFPVTKKTALNNLSAADIVALHLTGQEVPILLEPNDEMQGYSWYPTAKAKSLIQIITMANGKTFREGTEDNSKELWDLDNEKKTNHPKDIAVEVEIEDTGTGKTKTLAFPTTIAFDATETGEEGLGSGWLPKKGKASEKQIDSGVLQALFFSDSSDHESDSYDSQLEYFESMAEPKRIAVFANQKKAALFAAENAVNGWEVRSALRDLGAKRVVLEVTREGIKILVTKPGKTTKK